MSMGKEVVDDKRRGWLEKAVFTVVLLLISYHHTSIQKLEERIYSIQEDKFTSRDAAALEGRVVRHIEMVNSKMDAVVLLLEPKIKNSN